MWLVKLNKIDDNQKAKTIKRLKIQLNQQFEMKCQGDGQNIFIIWIFGMSQDVNWWYWSDWNREDWIFIFF